MDKQIMKIANLQYLQSKQYTGGNVGAGYSCLNFLLPYRIK